MSPLAWVVTILLAVIGISLGAASMGAAWWVISLIVIGGISLLAFVLWTEHGGPPPPPPRRPELYIMGGGRGIQRLRLPDDEREHPA